MSLSFAQLTQALTQAQLTSALLNALQGVGFVAQAGLAPNAAGLGTGTVTYVSGVPNNNYAVVIRIIASGEPGVGTFQYATDALTFSGTITLPSSGAPYVLGATGITIAFNAGPVGSGTSFVAGDTYTVALTVPNFPVTSWASGSTPRTLIALDAQALASFDSAIALVTAGGLINFATGPWLDLLASNVYNFTRNPAVATKGTVTLTDASGAGPFTIQAGGMWVASANGLRYTNTTLLTLPKSGTVSGTWQAEQAAAAYNVGNGSITSIVAGTLPGVTVNNPDPGSGTWVTTQGNDTETDAALASRCVARWPALGTAATAATYDLWAKTASANVTRTVVFADPSTPGQVDVYLAGPSGGSGGGDVTAVTTYINARTPLTTSVNIQAATNVAITPQTTVTYRSAVTTLAQVQAAITANMTAFFQTIPIGKDAGGTVKLYLDQLREQIMAVPGVVNADPFTSPGGDTGLTTGQVATLTLNFGAGWTFTAI